MPNYGYFLPIAENLFTSVKFLDLSPKTELKFGVPEALAENGGFEPPRAFTQHAFQACAIGH